MLSQSPVSACQQVFANGKLPEHSQVVITPTSARDKNLGILKGVSRMQLPFLTSGRGVV